MKFLDQCRYLATKAQKPDQTFSRENFRTVSHIRSKNVGTVRGRPCTLRIQVLDARSRYQLGSTRALSVHGAVSKSQSTARGRRVMARIHVPVHRACRFVSAPAPGRAARHGIAHRHTRARTHRHTDTSTQAHGHTCTRAHMHKGTACVHPRST